MKVFSQLDITQKSFKLHNFRRSIESILDPKANGRARGPPSLLTQCQLDTPSVITLPNGDVHSGGLFSSLNHARSSRVRTKSVFSPTKYCLRKLTPLEFLLVADVLKQLASAVQNTSLHHIASSVNTPVSLAFAVLHRIVNILGKDSAKMANLSLSLTTEPKETLTLKRKALFTRGDDCLSLKPKKKRVSVRSLPTKPHLK